MKVTTKLSEALVEFGPPPPTDAKSRLFVGAVRKDGKYPVTYVFPGSGRKIAGIITAEKLAQEKASGHYDVMPAGGGRRW